MTLIKTLGLALFAALALTAALASTASAQFTSNKEHTILTGSQKTGTNDIFTAGEGFGGMTCESVIFSGTMVNKSEAAQVITPTYETCKDTFGRTVDVDNGEVKGSELVNRLTYTYTTGAGKGTVDVSGKMTLTTTSAGSVVCTVVIKSPQTTNGKTYTNLGGTKGIEITTHSNNVITTTSGGFFNCGVTNGEHKNGTYDGTAVVTGKDTSGSAAEIAAD
jgi:hypothetical protein